MAVRLFVQDREILSDCLPLDAVTWLQMHTLICSTCRYAPLYFRSKAAQLARSKRCCAFTVVWIQKKQCGDLGSTGCQPVDLGSLPRPGSIFVEKLRAQCVAGGAASNRRLAQSES